MSIRRRRRGEVLRFCMCMYFLLPSREALPSGSAGADRPLRVLVGVDVQLLQLLNLAQVSLAHLPAALSVDVPCDAQNDSDEAEEGEAPSEAVRD